MDIKKENEKIVTTRTFSECFYGYDDPELSNKIINRFDEILSYPYQPERSKREDMRKHDAVL